jgi:multidrug efflux pump subunit AcrB
MKPTPVASDVADGVKQKLGRLNGVRDLNVTSKRGIITVTAKIAPNGLKAVKEIIEGYKDSGFSVVLDRRASA